jgi:hypothetical protein
MSGCGGHLGAGHVGTTIIEAKGGEQSLAFSVSIIAGQTKETFASKIPIQLRSIFFGRGFDREGDACSFHAPIGMTGILVGASAPDLGFQTSCPAAN